MSGDPAQYDPDPRYKHMTLALAALATIGAGVLPVLFDRFKDAQPWNLQIIGAIGLFVAARLGFWWAVGFTGVAIGLKDVSMYLVHGFQPSPFSWPCFIAYAAVGWIFLRRTRSAGQIGAGALTGSLLFFLISNFVCWFEPALGYDFSLQGLVTCYMMAVPFFRGTIAGDLVFSAALFGTHAVLCRAYFPSKQTIAIRTEDWQ